MRELFDSPVIIAISSFSLWAIGQATPSITGSGAEGVIKALGPIALGVIALCISLWYAQRKDQQTMEWMSKENEEFRKTIEKLSDRVAECPKKG